MGRTQMDQTRLVQTNKYLHPVNPNNLGEGTEEAVGVQWTEGEETGMNKKQT